MENKTIIINLIQEKKRYWGKLLYQEYLSLFQKIHSNQILADLISKDLGIPITEKQIENIKKNHQKVASKIEKPQTKPKSDNEDFGQMIYDQIYNRPKKNEFNLDNL